MDGVSSHHSVPQPTSTDAPTTSHLPLSPTPSAHNKRFSEPTTDRQRRLLQNRNTNFPAKKLSLSNLGSRFSQLIHANDEQSNTTVPGRNQENTIPSCKQESFENARPTSGSLKRLSEFSTTSLSRKQRRSGNIPIFEDTPERPLLKRSPYSSPALYQEYIAQDDSPIGFDHIQDSIGNMRLREISGNERRGSFVMSSPLNGSVKGPRKYKSMQLKGGFDTQEYIDHLERQLHEANEAMYSPTSNRSLKDQLNTARYENERLRQDMTDMRDMFETEMKRAIERRAELEVELKRRVKNLEDELEHKVSVIQDLELQHDERRLDNNTIDNLKAAIEKLGQEKLSLEDENKSVSRRNEVLSELLAMSPTKLNSFELRSPIRERRGGGRPMSMIIPKLPSSPTGRQISQPASAVVSPSLSACAQFFNPVRTRAGSSRNGTHGLSSTESEALDTTITNSSLAELGYFGRCVSGGTRSRRSTMQSQISTNDTSSIVSDASSPADRTTHRVHPKRKPRKFMAGSTQLKPLLLPAMTSEVISFTSLSAQSSPKIEAVDVSTEELDDSVIRFENSVGDETIQLMDPSLPSRADLSSNSSKVVYRTLEDILAEHDMSMVSEQAFSPDYVVTSPGASGNDRNNRHEDYPDGWANLTSRESTAEPTIPIFRDPRRLYFNSDDFDGSSPSSTSEAKIGGLDLNALGQLEFPSPDYDAIPDANSHVDNTLLSHVPQPLFSINSISRQEHTKQVRHSLSDNSPSWTSTTDLSHIQGSSETRQILHNTQVKHDIHLDDVSKSSVTEFSKSSPSFAFPDTYFQHSRRPKSLPCTSDNRRQGLKPMTSYELIRTGQIRAKPLAALTIGTIFGTISKCTSHAQDFRRDPLALARRLIANAWFSNWKRFGKLSWWVLGLFVRTGIGGPKLKDWAWEQYDGEEIANSVCQRNDGAESSDRSTMYNAHRASHSATSISMGNTDIISGDKPKKGLTRSIMLWGKFSVAIMLAVGGAIVKGPEEMLKEINSRNPSNSMLEDSNVERSLSAEEYESVSIDRDRHYSTRQRADRQHIRGEHPSPLLRRTSLIETVFSPYQTLTDRNWFTRSEDFSANTDSEETLRAVRGFRPHVANVFTHGSIRGHQNYLTDPKTLTDSNSDTSGIGISSARNGTLQ